MGLKRVNIVEGKIGPNTAGDSREFAIITGGVAVVDKLVLNKHYRLTRPSDAEAIGITAEYDNDNDVRIRRHIDEFYRIAGEGKALNILVVAQTDAAPVAMITAAKTLVIEAGGNISDIVFALNPVTGYSETVVDGMSEDVMDALQPLQAFADWANEQDRPLHVIIEGRGLGDTVASLPNLRALVIGATEVLPGVLLSAHKLTVVIGQDWGYADTLSVLGKKFADVGTFLGCIAAQAWNRNPGEVETMNLQNAVKLAFLQPGFSNHKTYAEMYDSLETMDAKGYVFLVEDPGQAGVWWNDGHVCAPILVDADGNMNQHTIYYSHTFDMAKRALRIALLPEVKKVKPLEGGKLPAGLISYYNEVGNAAFRALAGKQLISEGITITDPDSDLLVEKILNQQFSVIPTGCVNSIEGVLNLKSL
ncbi:MAG: DUF2586 family protein [Bacteroidales bacterium]|nr:DUF2586 family protein [Bacteroidales bacterium]MDY0215956.1 DUF2586 family protein [Bacteroidales bacterium]